MRVLLVSAKSAVSRGGIVIWTEGYLERCPAHGIDCSLVNVEMIGERAQAGTARRNWKDEWVRTRHIFTQLKKALQGKPGVAHLNTSCGTFGILRDYLVARMICRRKVPLVVQYHCDIPGQIHNPVSKFFVGRLGACARDNLVLCQNSRQYLLENFGIESHIVPNYIHESKVLSQPRQIAEQLQEVLFIGRVCRSKGAAELWQLAERFPQLQFRLIGEISREVAAWEKPENIHFLGMLSHEQVLAQLDRTDLFLFPSHSEGFSLALLEAMARGVPIVATAVGAGADMLSGDCGIAVEKEDVAAMAQAITRLQSPDRRTEISRNAIAKVRTRYTTGAVLTQLQTYYES